MIRKRVSRPRPLLLIALLAAAAGLAVALLLRASQGPVHTDPPALQGSAEIRVLLEADAAREPIFATAWQGDDALWYLAVGGPDEATLSRIGRDGLKQQSWRVPVPLPPTVHTYMEWDATGNLWMGAGYGLAAFDPRTSKWVAATALDPKHELMSADALDGEAPDPGTWIAGLGSDDTGVLLVRHNVRAVFAVDTSKGPFVPTILSEAPSGLMKVDGVDVAVSNLGSRVNTLTAGKAVPADIADDPGVDFVSSRPDCSAWTSPAQAVAGVRAPGLTRVWPDLPMTPRNEVAASASGGWLAFAVSAASLLVRLDCENPEPNSSSFHSRTSLIRTRIQRTKGGQSQGKPGIFTLSQTSRDSRSVLRGTSRGPTGRNCRSSTDQ